MRNPTQGINPFDLLAYFKAYVQLTLDLDDRHAIMWWGPTRPQLAGQDLMVWFRPKLDRPDKSVGPGRWGNKTEVQYEVHLVTRNFSDESQDDIQRAKDFYVAYFKLEQAFQNLNLFNQYSGPGTDKVTGVWFPPQPLPKALPLTVEPMWIESLPSPDKTQKEEGNAEAVFTVILPAVIALVIPDN